MPLDLGILRVCGSGPEVNPQPTKAGSGWLSAGSETMNVTKPTCHRRQPALISPATLQRGGTPLISIKWPEGPTAPVEFASFSIFSITSRLCPCVWVSLGGGGGCCSSTKGACYTLYYFESLERSRLTVMVMYMDILILYLKMLAFLLLLFFW